MASTWWSKAETDLVVEMFNANHNDKEIAAALVEKFNTARTAGGVKNKRFLLKLSNRRRGETWTKADVGLLLQMQSENWSTKAKAEKLGRSMDAVRRKLDALRPDNALKQGEETWSREQLVAMYEAEMLALIKAHPDRYERLMAFQ
jgi:hypothetical protein